MRRYVEELVYTQRTDGRMLEGVLIRPAQLAPRPLALVWIHGNAGKFYDHPYVAIGHELAARGYAFLSGNTHGHDLGAMIWDDTGQPRPGGSAWERFSESPLDVQAWVAVAMQQGCAGVVLIGHSFGAVKVVYYQAQQQDPRVHGVVAASPDVLWSCPPERLAAAEQRVAAGAGEELLEATQVPWYRLSAQTVVERVQYALPVFAGAPDVPSLAGLRCPLLAFYGTHQDVGGAADLERIRARAAHAARVDVTLLDGADHAYEGHAPQVAALIAGWVAGLA